MGWRPDQIEPDRLLRAAHDTYAASIALFSINPGFHLLGTGHPFHLNGAKGAALNAGLAAAALILLDRGQEAAGSIERMHIFSRSQALDQHAAAIGSTLADDARHDCRIARTFVNQTRSFSLIYFRNGFIIGVNHHIPTPLPGFIQNRLAELEAVPHRVVAAGALQIFVRFGGLCHTSPRTAAAGTGD